MHRGCSNARLRLALLVLLVQLLALHVLAGPHAAQKDFKCATHAKMYNKYFGTHQIAPRYSFE